MTTDSAQPLVSVIIPLHNGKEFIAEAMDSVLTQTYPYFEVIVVDDGSVDNGCWQIPVDDRVRIIGTRRHGNATARNYGMEQSRGELITFLDQDDYWHREKLAIQTQHMTENDDCDVIISLVRYVFEKSTPRPVWLKDTPCREDRPGYLVGALLAKRKVFDRVGAFNTDFAYGSDSDWFFRVQESGTQLHVQDTVLLYKRIHENNQSRNVPDSRQDLFRLVKDSVHRKREKGES